MNSQRNQIQMERASQVLAVEQASAKPCLNVGDAPLEKVSRLLSDIGNGARFARQHREKVMHVNGLGWLAYDGRRWAVDDTSRVVALAKQTALGIVQEIRATGDDAMAIFKWAARSQSRERLNAMIDLAKPELAAPIGALDSDPMVLNLLNGTFDLRTGKLAPHRPDDRIAKLASAAWRPDATAPQFVAFLNRIFRGNRELVPYIIRVLGYCLTGSTAEQALFFLWGNGANGKSTLIDTVLHVFGDYSTKAARDLLTVEDAHPANTADLQGRRLAVVAESGDGHRWDEAKMKDLVGEKIIKARRMRENFFEFPMTAKLILQSNHKPIVRGTDHGFWRRMRLVPFLETIGEDERNTELGAKLQGEADGILQLLVAGCNEWQASGLGLPNVVKMATNEYRAGQDIVGQFLAECCLVAANAVATAADLYRTYGKWADSAGERTLSQTRFGLALAEHGLTRGRSSQTDRIVWHGVGLKVPVEEALFPNTPNS